MKNSLYKERLKRENNRKKVTKLKMIQIHYFRYILVKIGITGAAICPYPLNAYRRQPQGIAPTEEEVE
jgi:hypothetical protein